VPEDEKTPRGRGFSGKSRGKTIFQSGKKGRACRDMSDAERHHRGDASVRGELWGRKERDKPKFARFEQTPLEQGGGGGSQPRKRTGSSLVLQKANKWGAQNKRDTQLNAKLDGKWGPE